MQPVATPWPFLYMTSTNTDIELLLAVLQESSGSKPCPLASELCTPTTVQSIVTPCWPIYSQIPDIKCACPLSGVTLKATYIHQSDSNPESAVLLMDRCVIFFSGPAISIAKRELQPSTSSNSMTTGRNPFYNTKRILYRSYS